MNAYTPTDLHVRNEPIPPLAIGCDDVEVGTSPSGTDDFGEWMKMRRQALGISLRQLSERTRVSNPYLSQVERGVRVADAAIRDRVIEVLREVDDAS